jgi:hypothetical protein
MKRFAGEHEEVLLVGLPVAHRHPEGSVGLIAAQGRHTSYDNVSPK